MQQYSTECIHCGQEDDKPTLFRDDIYCSEVCAKVELKHNNGEHTECHWCGEEHKTINGELKRDEFFCSGTCMGKYLNNRTVIAFCDECDFQFKKKARSGKTKCGGCR